MSSGISLDERLGDQIDEILSDLMDRSHAECILLVDISGQLINYEGQLEEGDLSNIAALAAGDMSAMAELSRQIGEEDPHGSFLFEGEDRSLYMFNVASSFILIVVFDSDTPVGLIRLLVKRAGEQLHPLTKDFEEMMEASTGELSEEFGSGLAEELENAFFSDTFEA